jgi:hypothetical protein
MSSECTILGLPVVSGRKDQDDPRSPKSRRRGLGWGAERKRQEEKVYYCKKRVNQALVAHACNPSYWGSRDQEIPV